MTKIAIYGAGGLGKEVLTIIKAINHQSAKYECFGFFDDHATSSDVLGGHEEINAFAERLALVVAIGNPLLKRELVSRIHNPNVFFPSLIHPSVIFGDQSRVMTMAGVVIGAGSVLTVDITLEEHVLINLNCTVGHDVKIGEFSSLMPGVNLAGNVAIGSQTFIGAGANVINNLTIGERAVIGAGAVVISDVAPGTTVVGVPAKMIKKGK